jgi:AraC family transcriptional regulator, L-rhamnose operon regulatory protein RhaS
MSLAEPVGPCVRSAEVPENQHGASSRNHFGYPRPRRADSRHGIVTAMASRGAILAHATPTTGTARAGALLREAGLEHLVHAGYSRSVRASSWPLHDHANLLELHFFVRGALRCWIGSDLAELRGGEILLVSPAVVHGGWLGLIPPAELYWLGIRPWRPERGERVFGLSLTESATIRDALRNLSSRGLPAAGDLFAPFQRLVESYPPEDGPSLFALRAALLEIIAIVIRSGHANTSPQKPTRVRDALALMARTLEEPLAIPAIATALRVSASQLTREFREAMGISPKDYYLRARILEACRRMSRESASVTRVAHALGFTSSQYFATAFRRITGFSPTDYQRACIAPPPAEVIHWST